jgi:hypothetical protein
MKTTSNQSMKQSRIASGLSVKNNVKAGGIRVHQQSDQVNHNQTAPRGLKVKSGVKAGIIVVC